MSTITTKKIDFRNGSYEIHLESYETANELVNTCRTRNITDSRFKNMKAIHYSDSFEGVKNYDEALDLLNNGYQPTVESMRNVFKATTAGSQSRFKFDNNVYGFAPIVPLAMMGVPNSMMNMHMSKIKCKVIDVYYDMTCSCAIDSKDLIKAGQTLLGTIAELEKQGYRINLYTTMTFHDGRACDMLAVKVKSATQPMDLKRISFTASHTAFFRVIGFDWYSKVPDGKYRAGYGRSMYYDFGREESTRIMRRAFGNNAVYISAADVIRNGKSAVKGAVDNANSICED